MGKVLKNIWNASKKGAIIPLIFLLNSALPSKAQNNYIGGTLNSNSARGISTVSANFSFNDKINADFAFGSGEMNVSGDYQFGGEYGSLGITPRFSYQNIMKEQEDYNKDTTNSLSFGVDVQKEIKEDLILRYQGSMINDSVDTKTKSFESCTEHIDDPSVPSTFDIDVNATSNLSVNNRTDVLGTVLGVEYKNIGAYFGMNTGKASTKGNLESITEVTTDGTIAGIPIHDYQKTTSNAPIDESQDINQSSFRVSAYLSSPVLAKISAWSDMVANTKGSAKLVLNTRYADLDAVLEQMKKDDIAENSGIYNSDTIKSRRRLTKDKYTDTASISIDTDGNLELDYNRDNYGFGFNFDKSGTEIEGRYKGFNAGITSESGGSKVHVGWAGKF